MAANRDFDFEFGGWRVRHRRLKERLVGCDAWETFDGTSETRPVLGGDGNIEDNLIDLPAGAYRAVAIRSLDVQTGRWAIWWLASVTPHSLDTPVIGRFEGDVGAFYAEDTLHGRPIRVRFLWRRADASAPRWEQAMSADGGATWETNWTMDFSRA